MLLCNPINFIFHNKDFFSIKKNSISCLFVFNVWNKILNDAKLMSYHTVFSDLKIIWYQITKANSTRVNDEENKYFDIRTCCIRKREESGYRFSLHSPIFCLCVSVLVRRNFFRKRTKQPHIPNSIFSNKCFIINIGRFSSFKMLLLRYNFFIYPFFPSDLQT